MAERPKLVPMIANVNDIPRALRAMADEVEARQKSGEEIPRTLVAITLLEDRRTVVNALGFNPDPLYSIGVLHAGIETILNATINYDETIG